MSETATLAGYSALPEPELLFANNKKHKHPLLGLIANGPYGLRFGAPSKLRVALLAPTPEMARLKNLVEELNRPASPIEAKNYYPKYDGFEMVFRTPLATPDARLSIGFPDELETLANRLLK